jgi:hypothetical protein
MIRILQNLLVKSQFNDITNNNISEYYMHEIKFKYIAFYSEEGQNINKLCWEKIQKEGTQMKNAWKKKDRNETGFNEIKVNGNNSRKNELGKQKGDEKL